jgi:class 3 adenylate cyclase
MTDEVTRNSPEAQEATILIVDIVGYSDLPGPDQLTAVERLTASMRATEVIRRSSHNEVFFLPTGDGVVVGFLGLPERPLELASQLHTLYKNDRFLLKIGIHSGYIFRYVDLNANWNYAGSSINLAQRVESCCNPGHILVAQPSPERLQDLSRWSGYFRGPYTFRVKHGREVRAYNFVNDERSIGNPAEPIGPFRVIQPTHTNLPARLATLGVVPVEELRTNSMRRILADRLAIEDAILDSPIRGFAGVPSSQIEIEITHEASGR